MGARVRSSVLAAVGAMAAAVVAGCDIRVDQYCLILGALTGEPPEDCLLAFAEQGCSETDLLLGTYEEGVQLASPASGEVCLPCEWSQYMNTDFCRGYLGLPAFIGGPPAVDPCAQPALLPTCPIGTCRFGSAVAVGPDLAAISDTSYTGAGGSGRGAVQVFGLAESGPVPLAFLTSSVDRIGDFMVFSGKQLAVSASNSVNVYREVSPAGWSLQQTLTPLNPQSGTLRGIDATPTRLIVGFTPVFSVEGWAFIYAYDAFNEVWILEATLAPPESFDANRKRFFGVQVALADDGRTAFVAAGLNNQGASNRIAVYEFDGGAWSFAAVLEPPSSLNDVSQFASRSMDAGDGFVATQVVDATPTGNVFGVAVYTESPGGWAPASIIEGRRAGGLFRDFNTARVKARGSLVTMPSVDGAGGVGQWDLSDASDPRLISEWAFPPGGVSGVNGFDVGPTFALIGDTNALPSGNRVGAGLLLGPVLSSERLMLAPQSSPGVLEVEVAGVRVSIAANFEGDVPVFRQLESCTDDDPLAAVGAGDLVATDVAVEIEPVPGARSNALIAMLGATPESLAESITVDIQDLRIRVRGADALTEVYAGERTITDLQLELEGTVRIDGLGGIFAESPQVIDLGSLEPLQYNALADLTPTNGSLAWSSTATGPAGSIDFDGDGMPDLTVMSEATISAMPPLPILACAGDRDGSSEADAFDLFIYLNETPPAASEITRFLAALAAGCSG